MKNIKSIALVAILFFGLQPLFSQSEECKKNLTAVMADYQKKISGDESMTREAAETLLTQYMDRAYEKFPDCFPPDYKVQHKKHVEEAKKIDAVTEKKQEEINKKEVPEPAPKKVAPEKAATANLASAKNPGIVQSEKYQALKKECSVILRDQMTAMKKDMDIKKSKARTAIQRRQVMEGYTRLRMEVIHACVMDKMEEDK